MSKYIKVVTTRFTISKWLGNFHSNALDECRQKQSIQQIGALSLLIMGAVLLSIGEGSSRGSNNSDPDRILFYGIAPVLIASVLSGLASALCQWASQVCEKLIYYQSRIP